MNLRVTVTGKVNCHEAGSRSESEPEQGVSAVRPERTLVRFKSLGVDAKPSDLHMSRMKSR